MSIGIEQWYTMYYYASEGRCTKTSHNNNMITVVKLYKNYLVSKACVNYLS